MAEKKRGPGRPRTRAPGAKPARQTKSVSFSLTEAERAELARICTELQTNQSDFLRRAMDNWWIFRLNDAQIDALKALGGMQ